MSRRFFSIFFLLSLFYPIAAQAQLKAEQLVVVANKAMPESIELAKYYAAKRSVPEGQIIALNLPLEESITRSEYETQLLLPLRKEISDRGLTKVIAILTTTGVPLRVKTPELNSEEQAALEKVEAAQISVFAQLQQVLKDLQKHAGVEAVGDPSLLERQQNAKSLFDMGKIQSTLLVTLNETYKKAAEKAVTIEDAAERAAVQKQLLGLGIASGGVQALLQQMISAAQSKDGANAPQINPEALSQLATQISSAQQLVLALRNSSAASNLQPPLELVRMLFGLNGLFSYLSEQVANLKGIDAAASVDSELSMLWWNRESYALAGRVPNPFPQIAAKLGGKFPAHALPMLLVSRIEAPTLEIAKRLIDSSLEAEQNGPKGIAYFDARGIKAGDDNNFGAYDEIIRNTASLFKSSTPYEVVLENSSDRFSEAGSAKNAAIYVGWYKLRSYEDAFTFTPGAIGFHVASEEAISLRNPKEPGWCKNAIEHGIAATLGAVEEPYLDAFPNASDFFGLLLTGQYSLAEAFYLTVPQLSWRMVLVGDPLYNPWGKKPLLTPEQFMEKSAAFTKLQRFPSNLSAMTFDDPVQTAKLITEQRGLAFQQLLSLGKQIEEGTKNLLQSLKPSPQNK